MNELDLAAKALMRDAPEAFARLALGRRVRIASATAEDVEAPALERRVDKVLRVKVEGRARALRLHFEVAASWTGRLPRRVYEYRTLLQRGGEPVDSALVCLKKGRKQGLPRGRYVERGALSTLCFTFRVICLWKLSVAALRRLGPVFLPFVHSLRA